MTKYKPIIRWPGGKTRMLPKLLSLIPWHTCYVEVFGGGLALLLAKPRSSVEIVNDINADLIALYRCVQWHVPELIREMQFMLASRKNLKDFVAQPGLTDIQRAARFLVCNKTSFGGGMTSWGVSRTEGGGNALARESIRLLLGRAHDRLDKVTIENISWDHCLSLYDGPDTFFFLDPPYLGSKVGSYAPFTEADMTRMAKTLKKAKGQWLLTVDGSEFNRRLFRPYQITEIETRSQRVNVKNSPRQTFRELIVTSPPRE